MRRAPGPMPGEPTLWAALRASASAFTDDVARFIAANVVLAVTVLIVALLAQLHLGAFVLVVLVVPATSALGRMAAFTARLQVARLSQGRQGATHRWPGALVLGFVQVMVLAIGWFSLQIGLTGRTLPSILGGVVAGWVLLLTIVVAVALWPLLLDPERDEMALRALLRLALVTVAARPGRILGLVVFEVVLALITFQTIIGAVLLPSVGVLLAAHTVIPLADALEGREVGSR